MKVTPLVELLARLDKDQRAAFIAELSPTEREALIELVATDTPVTDPLAGLHWSDWHQRIFPQMFPAGYTFEQQAAWDWWWQIRRGVSQQPLAVLWPRGWAKSVNAEVGLIRTGAAGLRSFGLYVSATQDLADGHVQTISAIMESPGMEEHYPGMADRAVNKFGSARAWRRDRLITRSRFMVESIGLDTASRGIRFEEHRPDILVLDDIDQLHMSPLVVKRNLETLTRSIIPALADHAIIFVAQNLIHANSVASLMSTGKTDLLADAIRSGPFPAVRNMVVEQVARTDGQPGQWWQIVSGEPTWPQGMGLGRCNKLMREIGLDAFIAEAQQDVEEVSGALLKRADWDLTRVSSHDVPVLDQRLVAVDPNKTGRADDAGVVVIGKGIHNGMEHSYTLADLSDLSKPSEWRDVAVRAAQDYGCGEIAVEPEGLGEHALLTLKDSPLMADNPIDVVKVHARLGKKDRARPIARMVKQDMRHHHVGVLPYNEGQWAGWDPASPSLSPGSVDAEVHGVTRLMIDNSGETRFRRLQ